VLTSGRLQVDSTGPVGEAGNLHPSVRLQCNLAEGVERDRRDTETESAGTLFSFEGANPRAP